MQKKLINLIIVKESEPLILTRLKFFLPIAASASLVIFLVVFIVSIIYVNTNIAEFNKLKAEVERLESKISQNKDTEVYYTLTTQIVNTLDDLILSSSNFSRLLSTIADLSGEGVEIPSVFIEQSGKVNISVKTDSSGDLVDFIEKLISLEEEENKFSQLEVFSVVRDKKGQYLFNVGFIVDKSLIL